MVGIKQLLLFFNNNNKFFIALTCIILLVFGKITSERVSYFFFILIIIILYKIIMYIIDLICDKYFLYNLYELNYYKSNIIENQNIIIKEIKIEKLLLLLLKLYKYKNLLIYALAYISTLFYNFIWSLTNKNINSWIINIIYFILFNLFLINPIKIILYKIYHLLLIWKTKSLYEILFIRLFGLILSILVFTNILKFINEVIFNDNVFLKLYIFLVVLGFISNIKSLKEIFKLNKSIKYIESIRFETTILGLALKTQYKIYNIINFNKKIKKLNLTESFTIFFWWNLSDYMNLNYNAWVKIAMLNYEDSFGFMWLDYNNKPSYIFYLKLIEKSQLTLNITTIILAKHYEFINLTLKERIELNLYLDFQKLVFKLWLFLLWDYETELKNKRTNLKVLENEYGYGWFSIECEINILQKVTYNNELINLKLNKFWSLSNNENFYKKVYTYLHLNENNLSLNYFGISFENFWKSCTDLINLNESFINESNSLDDIELQFMLEQYIKALEQEYTMGKNKNVMSKYQLILDELSRIENEV